MARAGDAEAMDIGSLKEALHTVTDLGSPALNGGTLGADRAVLLCVHGHYFPLEDVAVTVADGSFILVLRSNTSLPM
jgi:hypothetical protein